MHARAERIGGGLSIVSTPGAGTRVTASLPMVSTEDTDEEEL